MNEIQIYDCHNTNSIMNTNKYVLLEDYLALKLEFNRIEKFKTVIYKLIKDGGKINE